MRFVQYVVAGSMIGCVLTASAFGQGTQDLRQPSSVQKTAFEYDNYLYFTPQESATAATPAPAQKEEAAAASATPVSSGSCPCAKNSCDNCDYNCGFFRCNIGDPWTMPQLCALQKRGITMGGWVEAGAYGNQYDTKYNGPIGFRDDANFNLDQLWGYMEKKTDTGGCGWDVGGRIDYIFGVDGPDAQSFGDHSFDWNWTSSRTSAALGSRALYGSAMPNAYGEIAYNRLTVKVGHFLTPMGYETVPATQNFFYSHSYCNYFGEPFTHTGALATMKFNDKLSVSAGMTNGCDGGFDNNNGASTFLGGINYNLGEKTTLAWNICGGYNGNGTAYVGAPQGDIFISTFVLTHKLTHHWNYVFQTDYGINSNLPGSADASWYGINQYLIYQLNKCWGFGGRIEWFRDDDGTRVYGMNGNYLGEGSYCEMATGINYKPHANVMIRPELRYDWTDGVNAFNDGTRTTQVSGGCDVIVTF